MARRTSLLFAPLLLGGAVVSQWAGPIAGAPTLWRSLGAVHDPLRDVTVLVGLDSAFQFGTWEWNGSAWTRRATATTPRGHHRACPRCTAP